MFTESFSIADRFCGPPRSGNGGYVCGRLARHLPGTVAARLKAPPPLNTPLHLTGDDTLAQLFAGETLIAEARPATLDLQPPPCPAFEEAEQAAPAFIGFKVHAFPGCFVCGPARAAHDGLRIFPGPLAGSTTIAAPWVPDASLADDAGHIQPEFLWSALDCTGAFTITPGLPEGRTIVLGELCATLHDTLAPGERCVVLGWPLGSDGRKHFAGSAVYAPGGRLVALARAVWIEVPTSAWD